MSSTRSSIQRQVSLSVACILVLLVALEVFPSASGQITFSKDWRAGGKRSVALSAHGVSVLEVPCDQLAEYSNTKIKELVRKEALALLQCEISPNKNDIPTKK